MKIYKIPVASAFLKPQIKSINFGREENSTAVTAPILPERPNAATASLGKSMLAVGRFEETLAKNWFQLKPGEAPDDFQQSAAKSILAGHDTLVVAPTGTGKTAIALYAISNNMSQGKSTVYTAPLKALSGEKFRQFCTIFGEENVGLLTGDTKIRPDAPIVVMTTEVYRNQVFGDQFNTDSVSSRKPATVIFDELHYLGDIDRGGSWEQSIILAPKDTQILSLSATIQNNQEINDWVSKIRGTKGDLILSEKRHVPLTDRTDKAVFDPELSFEHNVFKNVRAIVERKEHPVIVFVFSKKKIHNLMEGSKTSSLTLNSSQEQYAIERIIKEYKQKGKYLGENLDIEALKKGYASHTAGLLPTQKELIEELAKKKLVKVIYATGTLSAGINLPAKSVLVTELRVPAGYKSAEEDGKRYLTVNEIHQMFGRAGRRGIDTVGYFSVMAQNKDEAALAGQLINSKPISIASHMDPDYSFVAGYYGHTQDDATIKKVLSQSLKAYDASPENATKKADKLMEQFYRKREILQELGYIGEDKKLTAKGQLLTKLNGYQQIPIIDLIHGKKLAGVSPVELAGCVAAIAHTNEEIEERKSFKQAKMSSKHGEGKHKVKNQPVFEFDHHNNYLKWFVQENENSLRNYNKIMSKGPEFHAVAQDADVAKHLFMWAKLNDNNPNSIQSWKSLCGSYVGNRVDEGSMFKEITLTADLLKQMLGITEIGLRKAANDADSSYFSELKNTIEQTIKLICREPIPVRRIIP